MNYKDGLIFNFVFFFLLSTFTAWSFGSSLIFNLFLMNAMLFAAGLGTRLRPLTDNQPKALVTVAGQTLLERSIHLLAMQGVTRIVINVHYHAGQIVNFVQNQGYFGLDIQFSDEREELLETGGGLLKAAPLLNNGKPFIVLNSDIICNIDFAKMLKTHLDNRALATLAVRDRAESSRQLLFDEQGLLGGWENRKTAESLLKPLAFSGIHILNPEWFELCSQRGKFSIIDSYLELGRKWPIVTHRHDEDYWFDVGSIEKLAEAETFLKGK